MQGARRQTREQGKRGKYQKNRKERRRKEWREGEDPGREETLTRVMALVPHNMAQGPHACVCTRVCVCACAQRQLLKL